MKLFSYLDIYNVYKVSCLFYIKFDLIQRSLLSVKKKKNDFTLPCSLAGSHKNVAMKGGDAREKMKDKQPLFVHRLF